MLYETHYVCKEAKQAVGKSKKEKLIVKNGDFSKTKVKEYAEKNDKINENIVSRGKDITFNKL